MNTLLSSSSNDIATKTYHANIWEIKCLPVRDLYNGYSNLIYGLSFQLIDITHGSGHILDNGCVLWWKFPILLCFLAPQSREMVQDIRPYFKYSICPPRGGAISRDIGFSPLGVDIEDMEFASLEWGQAPKPPSFVALRATTQSTRWSLIKTFVATEKQERMAICGV